MLYQPLYRLPNGSYITPTLVTTISVIGPDYHPYASVCVVHGGIHTTLTFDTLVEAQKAADVLAEVVNEAKRMMQPPIPESERVYLADRSSDSRPGAPPSV